MVREKKEERININNNNM